MQVGDLVTFTFQTSRWRKGESVDIGLVVETGKFTGNTNIKVLWKGETEPRVQKTSHLRLVDKSLTQP
tara:strand:+ start:2257 stop:2460 length:204 start_codon:yes stop_codon:yes gene_type:complete